MSDDTNTNGPNSFIKHPFDGSRSQFNEYTAEIYTNLLIECPDSSNLMETEWVQDPVTKEPITHPITNEPLPACYKPVVVPAFPATPTQNILSHITAAKAHNNECQKIYKTIRKVISARLAPAFLKKFQAVRQDLQLYDYWKNFQKEFGANSGGKLEIAEDKIHAMLYPMKSDTRFASWISQKETDWNIHKIDPELWMGLLLTVGNLPFSIRLLPERLWSAGERARLTCQDYDETKSYLRSQDELYFNSQLDKDSKEEKTKNKNTVKAVKQDSHAFKQIKVRCECGKMFKKFAEFVELCKTCYEGSSHDNNNSHTNNSNTTKRKFNNQNNKSTSSTSSSKHAKKRKFNNKGKPQRINAIVEIEEDSHDEDNDNDSEPDDDEEEYVYGNTRNTVGRIRMIKQVRNNNSSSTSGKTFTVPNSYYEKVEKVTPQFSFLCDSGAAQHCCTADSIDLLHDVTHYEHPDHCEIKLLGANCEPLQIIGKGYFNDMTEPIYVINNLDENLFSTTNSELVFLQLSKEHKTYVDDEPITGLLTDKSGNTKLLIDDKLNIDLFQYNNEKLQHLNPIEIMCNSFAEPMENHYYKTTTTNTQDCDTIYSIKIYGLANKTPKEIVDYLSDVFLCSKDHLIHHCSMSNFPVNEKQVRKHFSTSQAYRDGQQRMRNTPFRKTPTDSMSRAQVDSNPFKLLESRNMKIGVQVSTDQIGITCKNAGQVFVDKASGYIYFEAYTLKKDNPSSINYQTSYTHENLQKVIAWYKKYNHSISNLISDSHSIYRSKSVKTLCQLNGISQIISPPGMYQLNGLAEVNIRTISNLITSMYSLAPYIPHALWPVFAAYAVLLINLRPSRIPGNSHISRYEEFTKIKPDFKKLALLPAGIPVSCVTTRESRKIKGKFTTHAVIGLYMSPDPSSPAGIIAWNPVTKLFIFTSSYETLSRQQVPYECIKLDPFNGTQLLPTLRTDDQLVEENNLLPSPTNLTIEQSITDSNIPTLPDPQIFLSTKDSTISEGVTNQNSSTTLSESVVLSNNTTNITNTDVSNTAVSTILPTSTTSSIVPTTHIDTDVNTTDADKNVTQHIPVSPVHVTTNQKTTSTITTPTTKKSKKTKGRKTSKATGHITPSKVSKKRPKGPKRIVLTIPSLPLQRSQRKRNVPERYRIRFFKKEIKKFIKKNLKLFNKVEQEEMEDQEEQFIYKTKKERDYDNPTYKQAKNRDDWPLWETAINSELAQMQKDKVFTFAKYEDLPKASNIIGSMFVLTIKRNKITGEIDKRKARLVALGNMQKENSFTEIKSSTVRANTVKLLLSLQAHFNAHAMSIDVTAAYLKSEIKKELNENLVIKLPEGDYAILNKYIYGLKQSGLQWQNNVTTFLKENHFTSTSDPLLFIKRFSPIDFIIISLHVDDFYVISTQESHLSDFYNKMQEKYTNITAHHGPDLIYLGLVISHDRINHNISISQPAYTEKFLQKCGFNITKGCSTPMSTTHNQPTDNDNQFVDKIEYMRLVGLLNYLAIYSRPDILFALSIVSQKAQKPTMADMLKVKRIFKYIFETKNKCIIFTKTENLDILCYVDASFNCYNDGKSHYAFMFCIGYCNAFFSIKSTKIKFVTLSSYEAEYVALAFAVKEGIYIKRLMKDLGMYNNVPIKFFEDNEPVIKMLQADQLIHNTPKHIRVSSLYCIVGWSVEFFF